nr:hypothetical protein Iba_chr05fCG2710 [Ipomoea batatas]
MQPARRNKPNQNLHRGEPKETLPKALEYQSLHRQNTTAPIPRLCPIFPPHICFVWCFIFGSANERAVQPSSAPLGSYELSGVPLESDGPGDTMLGSYGPGGTLLIYDRLALCWDLTNRLELRRPTRWQTYWVALKQTDRAIPTIDLLRIYS